jgi:hypothetical protein
MAFAHPAATRKVAPECWRGVRSPPVYAGGFLAMKEARRRPFVTSGNRSYWSETSQLVQRNFRPPVFTRMKLMALWHFGQEGGGGFLGM